MHLRNFSSSSSPSLARPEEGGKKSELKCEKTENVDILKLQRGWKFIVKQLLSESWGEAKVFLFLSVSRRGKLNIWELLECLCILCGILCLLTRLYQETSNTYIIRVNYYQSLTFMNVIIDVEGGDEESKPRRREWKRNQNVKVSWTRRAEK